MKSKQIQFIFGILIGVFLVFVFFLVNNIIIMNTINFREEGKIIIFENNVLSKLNSDYQNSRIEKVYCLGGISKENEIIINKIDEIVTEKEGTKTEINLVGECANVDNKDLVGIIHFHHWVSLFQKTCLMSDDDNYIFGTLSETSLIKPNNIEINAIQCGNHRLFIIDNSNFKQSLRWLIK